MTLRHLRHQVRGRRRHHDQIALARETDMAGVELALGIEQIGIAALVRQRACRKRCHELLRSPGQYAADVDLPLLQPPDQVQRLVGGDAAADDQGNAGLDRRTGDPGSDVRSRPDGLRGRCGELEGATLYGLPQDHPNFLFHGTAVLGRAQP